MRQHLEHTYHEQHPLSHAIALMRLLQNTPQKQKSSFHYVSIELAAMAKNRDLEALFHLQPHITFTMDWDKQMATKKNQPSFNLIEYKMDATELIAFETWAEKTPVTFQELLNKLAEKDYKCSFSFVENSEAWCVSITGKPDAKFNEGATLTTWCDEPLEGLAMAVYKATVIFSGGVWKTRHESRRG